MTDHTLTVHVPDPVFHRLNEIAEATVQPVEQVLLQRIEASFANSDLDGLPSAEQAELGAFYMLSEPTLRSIAREQMPRSTQDRMIELGDRQSHGTITPVELDEYRKLVEAGEQLLLRKAWAAKILMARGLTISADDFIVPDA